MSSQNVGGSLPPKPDSVSSQPVPAPTNPWRTVVNTPPTPQPASVAQPTIAPASTNQWRTTANTPPVVNPTPAPDRITQPPITNNYWTAKNAALTFGQQQLATGVRTDSDSVNWQGGNSFFGPSLSYINPKTGVQTETGTMSIAQSQKNIQSGNVVEVKPASWNDIVAGKAELDPYQAKALTGLTLATAVAVPISTLGSPALLPKIATFGGASGGMGAGTAYKKVTTGQWPSVPEEINYGAFGELAGLGAASVYRGVVQPKLVASDRGIAFQKELTTDYRNTMESGELWKPTLKQQAQMGIYGMKPSGYASGIIDIGEEVGAPSKFGTRPIDKVPIGKQGTIGEDYFGNPPKVAPDTFHEVVDVNREGVDAGPRIGVAYDVLNPKEIPPQLREPYPLTERLNLEPAFKEPTGPATPMSNEEIMLSRGLGRLPERPADIEPDFQYKFDRILPKGATTGTPDSVLEDYTQGPYSKLVPVREVEITDIPVKSSFAGKMSAAQARDLAWAMAESPKTSGFMLNKYMGMTGSTDQNLELGKGLAGDFLVKTATKSTGLMQPLWKNKDPLTEQAPKVSKNDFVEKPSKSGTVNVELTRTTNDPLNVNRVTQQPREYATTQIDNPFSNRVTAYPHRGRTTTNPSLLEDDYEYSEAYPKGSPLLQPQKLGTLNTQDVWQMKMTTPNTQQLGDVRAKPSRQLMPLFDIGLNTKPINAPFADVTPRTDTSNVLIPSLTGETILTPGLVIPTPQRITQTTPTPVIPRNPFNTPATSFPTLPGSKYEGGGYSYPDIFRSGLMSRKRIYPILSGEDVFKI